MHVTDLHRRSLEWFAARLDALEGDVWAAPTPCADWDVRALLNHVVSEDLWTVPMMEGATIEEVGDRFEGDLLGVDPVATARAACDAAATAAASGVVAGRTVHLSFGDTPADEYAYQLAADHIVHGWDLAAATGGDRTIDPELVEACAAWFAEREDLYRAAGAIGERPAVEQAPDDAQARLLVAFGRDPSWTPG
ncbi:MAG TPA: TIGR03086 family metal-binding protein [Acidimicrobiales bacterium]